MSRLSFYLMLAVLATGTMAAAPGVVPAQPAPAATPPPVSVKAHNAQQDDLTLPDLFTLPPADLELNQNADLSWRVVRFDNTIGNEGTGPLEVVGQPAGAGKYQVRQRLFTSSGRVGLEPLINTIEYHAEHSHWHLADFARYELWSTNPDGTLRDILDVNGKVSYCLMDTEKNENSPDSARGYILCGPTKQGISVGWLDTYHSHFPGQFLTLTGLPSGIYAIRSIVDPANHLREIDITNNDAVTYFRLDEQSIEPVATPGLIWAWDRPGLAVPEDMLN